MTIEDDREEDLSPNPPWPVRASRYLERRPRMSVVAAVLVVAVVASLATLLSPLEAPAPTAASPSVTVDITLFDLRGLAYHRAVATPGLNYDLMFSVTAPFPPSGGVLLSDVYRVDTARGTTAKIDQVGAPERGAQVFADPRGGLMLVASQFDLAIGRQDGLLVLQGPPLDVVSALFLGPADERAIVVASTARSVVDVTLPDHQRVIADVGGTLLGRLDDGRLVLASPVSSGLVVQAVSLDGSLTELGRIARARGPAALQRFPTPTSPFRVLALRDLEAGSPGNQAVAALDLMTGALSDIQVIGFDSTFAPETNKPGVYVYAQRGEVRIVGRGTQNIEVPPARYAFLHPLRSWSPDGLLIAFGAESPAGKVGIIALNREGRVVVDVQPEGTAMVQLIGWVQRR
jgi:hypothetical protein